MRLNNVNNITIFNSITVNLKIYFLSLFTLKVVTLYLLFYYLK